MVLPALERLRPCSFSNFFQTVLADPVGLSVAWRSLFYFVSQPASTHHIIGILPARWGSTRFPGKPLHLIAGKPLIQHVWERCQSSTKLAEILVATDDERIVSAVNAFGGKAVMTSPDHPTGTDRLAEVAKQVPGATHILNIQGDEPLIDPALIDQLAQALIDDPGLHMVTAANPLDPADPAVADPNVVKTVLKQNGHALYFSRSPLPYFRNPVPGLQVLRHKGIYGYRRDFLETFVTWPPSPLEQAESLEQLRALENGANIRVLLTNDTSPGVDTPEQALEIERLLSLLP
ncbi:MAG: 3-deoxy-manno-octulosonate cytidylyltransferase [Verrucomicrobiota bacterium]